MKVSAPYYNKTTICYSICVRYAPVCRKCDFDIRGGNISLQCELFFFLLHKLLDIIGVCVFSISVLLISVPQVFFVLLSRL
jgi:hypothetical protein